MIKKTTIILSLVGAAFGSKPSIERWTESRIVSVEQFQNWQSSIWWADYNFSERPIVQELSAEPVRDEFEYKLISNTILMLLALGDKYNPELDHNRPILNRIQVLLQDKYNPELDHNRWLHSLDLILAHPEYETTPQSQLIIAYAIARFLPTGGKISPRFYSLLKELANQDNLIPNFLKFAVENTSPCYLEERLVSFKISAPISQEEIAEMTKDICRICILLEALENEHF